MCVNIYVIVLNLRWILVENQFQLNMFVCACYLFEHVKHDYAPIHTIDVALAHNICTEQIAGLDTTED